MGNLLTISIGPVQEFIAAARRSRDLWFGSWLLSELSKAAAEQVVSDNGLDSLIFPAINGREDLRAGSAFSVVNKIVALVEDPATTAHAAEQAARKRLRELADRAYSEINRRHAKMIKGDVRSYLHDDIARAQVNDLIEFFWAAYPCTDLSAGEEYRHARRQVERLLAARKSTRNFNQVLPLGEDGGWGSNAPKSSLDGQRESVINENAYKELQPSQLRRIYGVRQGERLCGVGLLKRHGNRDNEEKFFSTSHIAALPLLERLRKKDSPEIRGAVTSYIGLLRDTLNLDDEELGRVPSSSLYKAHPVFSRPVGDERIGYDGHLLFAERLRDYLEEKTESQRARANLEVAREALTEFLRLALDGRRPLPYYALLIADGDYMGAAISALETRDQHHKLSNKLATFAKEAGQIVIVRHGGSIVYAGGDDVLAFVPLHTALQCARTLSEQFQRDLTDFKWGSEGRSPTLSVGLVIAHHLDSLSDALMLARRAEKEAKMVEGKNALAVTVSKRGGEDTTVKGSWGTFDRRLFRLVQLHLEDAVPDGAAYELRTLDLGLKVDRRKHPEEYKILGEAVRKEAVRVLGRKRAKHGESELAEDVLAELTQYIGGNDEGTAAAGGPRITVGQLADELIVARIFADAMVLAETEAKELNSLLHDSVGKEGRG